MADEQKQVSLERIYVKDISFESPKAPDVFRKEWKPKINLDLNTRHNDLGDNHHEVILSLTITASDDEGTVLFLAEAQQAGVFLIQGLAGEEFARTLGSFCPSVLFPYARELIDSVVTKGSFPPLMLSPVNFDAIYLQVQAQREKETSTIQ